MVAQNHFPLEIHTLAHVLCFESLQRRRWCAPFRPQVRYRWSCCWHVLVRVDTDKLHHARQYENHDRFLNSLELLLFVRFPPAPLYFQRILLCSTYITMSSIVPGGLKKREAAAVAQAEVSKYDSGKQ
jgi:hypothetical protein